MSVGLFDRLRGGLRKTREGMLGRLSGVIKGHARIDDQMLEEIEEVLIQADIGVEASSKIIERVKQRVVQGETGTPGQINALLKEEILTTLEGSPTEDLKPLGVGERPYVIMVVGVNGTGKTTVVGKLAKRFADEGKKVLLAASDTFRAAAIEQLEIWAQRTGADMVRHQSGADPASVAFDALCAAQARRADVLIIDTAGRLHTKVNLMEQLNKIKRVLDRLVEGTPDETLLVLDATTGQNALSQAEYFNQTIGVTGIVLAKLDGTAKGGIAIAIKAKLNIPLKMIGIGEGADDLRDFDACEFVEALFG